MLHYSNVLISYKTLNFYIYPDIHFYPETSSYLKKSIEIRYLPYCLTLSFAYYLGFSVNRNINMFNIIFYEGKANSKSKRDGFLWIIAICNLYSYVFLEFASYTSFLPTSMLFFFFIAYLVESLGMFFFGYVRGK
jgi:hypothetical protein